MRAICNGPVQWRGCYSGQYDLWSPESFSHPAKMAPSLAFRILAHLEELGLLEPGRSTILDPMAGIGTSLLVAAIRGYRAVGIELEGKFVSMARANAERIALKGFGAPIEVIQGDARHLSELLAEKGMVALTSPPYAEAQEGGGIALKGYEGKKANPHLLTLYTPQQHGQSPGQIANLPDTVTLTSPPYEDTITGRGSGISWERSVRPRAKSMRSVQEAEAIATSYGASSSQIGQERQETYLDAMRQVYAEIAKVSPVLVVVVKDPTRAGKLRLLGKDTIRLMEAAGYRIFCRHQAILFEEQEQGHLFEGSVKQVKGRLGFFKRLAYRKGLEVASYEHVLIGVKEGSGPAAITSPPYTEVRPSSSWEPQEAWQPEFQGRGKTFHSSIPGQIGNLKDDG